MGVCTSPGKRVAEEDEMECTTGNAKSPFCKNLEHRGHGPLQV